MKGVPLFFASSSLPVIIWVFTIVSLSTAVVARADEPAAPMSTLQRLSTSLHGQLTELLSSQTRGAMDLAVCVGAPTGTAADAGAARLAERVQGILVAALAHDGWRSAAALSTPGACTATAEVARAEAQGRGIELVVHVASAVRDGRFFLEGSVLRSDRSLWREIAGGHATAMVGQVFASARLDAELRFYLGAPHPPLSKRTVGIWHETPGTVLALAAGDLDGDDLAELVVLRRDGVDVLGARGPGPRATMLATLPLSSLPPAAVASRDPVGTVALTPPDGRARRIALRTSDQASGILVGWDGTRFGAPEPLALADGSPAASGFPIDSGDRGLLCAILPPGRNVFEPRTLPCTDQAATRPATGAAPFWSVSFASVLQPTGEVVWSIALATAEPRLVSTVAGETHDLGPTGSAVLTADLDDDGIVEIVHTPASPPAGPDRVIVTSLAADGPHDVWTSRPTIGPVSAFASADLDGDGTLELVWSELHRGGSRLWVLADAPPRASPDR